MRKPEETRVLVVDDEEMLREAFAFDLKRRKYQVFTAGGGEDAWAMLQKSPVDIVVSDVRMPKGDGVSLLRKIKDLNPYRPIVILVTGYADISLEQAYDLGAEAVFPKPFDRLQLLAALERCTESNDGSKKSRPTRLPVKFPVRIQFCNSNLVVEETVGNLGRGGLFISSRGPFPEVEEECNFKILTDSVDLAFVEGRGVVRWVRNSEGALPTGYGVEFLSLADGCRTQVLNYINFLQTKSYIPLR